MEDAFSALKIKMNQPEEITVKKLSTKPTQTNTLVEMLHTERARLYKEKQKIDTMLFRMSALVELYEETTVVLSAAKSSKSGVKTGMSGHLVELMNPDETVTVNSLTDKTQGRYTYPQVRSFLYNSRYIHHTFENGYRVYYLNSLGKAKKLAKN